MFNLFKPRLTKAELLILSNQVALLALTGMVARQINSELADKWATQAIKATNKFIVSGGTEL